MKKLFNYALLAAALLIGVNVNAQTPVCELTMNGSTKQLTSLYDAFDSVTTAALAKSRSIAPEAYMGHEKDVEFCTAAPLKDSTVATIKLLDNATLDDGRYVILNAKKTKKIIYPLNAGERITLDLNGWTLTSNIRFDLIEASLYVINTNDDKQATINGNVAQFLNAYGSREKEAEDGFCRIVLGKNIVYNAEASNFGVAIFPNDYFFNKNVLATDGYTAQHGPGAGTVVDIFGEIRCTYGASSNGQLTEKEGNIPEINIHQGAKIVATNNNKPNDAIAIYAGGYAKWNINGYAEGATAIYIKAGEFDLDGATVVATGDYANPQPNGNGCDATGAAVVIDTHDNYAGGIVVNVEGNTSISSENGYGIQEVITKGDESVSHCEGINIESGNISGADGKAAISTTEVGTGVVTIDGGTFNSDVAIYIAGKTDGIINPSTDENGNTIYVVSTKPEAAGEWKNDITTAQAGDYIKLGQDADQTIGSGSAPASVEAEYLVAEKNAKVTIPTGKTLTVGEIVMSKDAQIVVEKGAKLIVEGTKGIVANQATNIVLKSEETDPAFFLLDPDVTSNKTPKAMLTFTANSWAEEIDYQYQYFGAPFVGGVIESITPVTFTGKTSFLVWTKSGWQSAGTIDNGVSTMDYSKFNTPFGFYAMCAVTPREDSEIDYVFTGRLFGNTDPEITVNYGYTALSNGFTGNMDGDAIFGALENNVEENVWVPITVENELQWEARNSGLRKLSEINPMATFMVKNDNPSSAKINLSYEDIVWNPTTTPKKAPKVNNFAMATVRVAGCGLNDIITFAEDNMFSADFDNGYDAEKYENTKIRFYVNADKEYDIFATDNVNNTFVGLMTTKAGKYTISFEDVTANFALVDTKTNARIEMSEGNTYEFLAEAGEDAYRFQIVEAAKAPTNNEKVNAAVKATKALINDQIVISNGERFFNMLGTDVK